jgi:hypothetical protein
MHDTTKAERLNSKKLLEFGQTKRGGDNSGDFMYRLRDNPGNFRIGKIRKQ